VRLGERNVTRCTVVFQTSQGSAEIQLGNALDLRIAGGAISAGGPVLASHVNGAWHVGSQRLERIVCRGPVRVEFESRTGRRLLGPFEELSLADDLAFGEHGVVARYQAAEQRWTFDLLPQLAAA
jgi:hypothetical protein